MGYTKLKLERQDALAIVTFNDPASMNAVGEAMRVELVDAMTRVLDDPEVRSILLIGEGRSFCAGANLKEFAADQARGKTPDVGGMLRGGVTDMLVRMTECEKPIVAAVNGAAAGFGCGLAFASDFVLMGRSGYFVQSFVKLGAVPDGGCSWFLPRLTGRARASAMMMLGDKITAEQAVEWGLAYQVFDDAELPGAARALATTLANGPTRAYARIKALIAESARNSLVEQLELETSHQVGAFDTADCREGVAAFAQGRAPRFRGE